MSTSLVVRGGTVVSSRGTKRADVLVRDGKVAEVAEDITGEFGREIDASGCLVFPGIIDAHTHPVHADDLASTAKAGAAGGVTSTIAYLGAFPTWGFEKAPVSDVIAEYVRRWDGVPSSDFGLHVAFDSQDNVRDEVPKLTSMGVSSFKFFVAYRKRGLMVDDGELLKAMSIIATHGGMIAIHAENGDGIDFLEAPLWDSTSLPNSAYLECRGHLLEAEAVLRVIALADAAGVPLYVPHVAAEDAIKVAQIARKTARVPVWIETCTHYLVLTNDEVIERGALSKIAPPLRTTHDNSALWRGLSEGALQVVGSDHAGRTLEMKAQGENILQAPFGAEGIEHLFPVLYSEGVRSGRISLERLAQVLCENPADLFGLSPEKGRLLPGADGDLVVLDPEGTYTCKADSHAGASDYCLYEGLSLKGAVRYTVRRGDVIFDSGGGPVVPNGGKFVRRPSFKGRPIPVVDGIGR